VLGTGQGRAADCIKLLVPRYQLIVVGVHAGCEGVAAINTIQSVMGINLDTLRPEPSVEGYSTPGGYSCKAVKPIALAKAHSQLGHRAAPPYITSRSYRGFTCGLISRIDAETCLCPPLRGCSAAVPLQKKTSHDSNA